MRETQPSICLVASGMTKANLRLQPWRYLHEVARQLTGLGHRVTVISDSGDKSHYTEDLQDVFVQRLPSVSNPRWRPNRHLLQAIYRAEPDIILWHVGFSTFLHQRLDAGGIAPVIGIFTSPIYHWHDLSRLGLWRLAKGYRLSLVHITNSLLPRSFSRWRMDKSGLNSLVVQTETTFQQLRKSGLWSGQIDVIPPGVDEEWFKSPMDSSNKLRVALGYQLDDVVVVYFGSPAPLRGLHTLIRAYALSQKEFPSLKLLILSRRRPGNLLSEERSLNRLLEDQDAGQDIKIVDGFLDQEDLVRHISTADLVALPFELVPSDAPLSLLETLTLGKPVITTKVACLPEMVSTCHAYLAEPADEQSLERTLTQAAQDLQSQKKGSNPKSSVNNTCLSARAWSQVGEEWSQVAQRL